MDRFLKDNRFKTYMDVINSEIIVFKEIIRKDFTELRLEKKLTDWERVWNFQPIQQQLEQSADHLDYLDTQMRRNNPRIEMKNEIESEHGRRPKIWSNTRWPISFTSHQKRSAIWQLSVLIEWDLQVRTIYRHISQLWWDSCRSNLVTRCWKRVV